MQSFGDQIQQLKDSFTFDSNKERIGRLAKTAVARAYADISAKSTWNYLRRRTQINTVAPYSTGTVGFNATTRYLTLTGGTWPVNAVNGELLINRNVYGIQRRVSDTVLQLLPDRCPATDLASLTTYAWVQSSYVLPREFVELRGITEIERLWNVTYMSPEMMLQRAQLWYTASNSLFYTILGVAGGRMTIQFQPPPSFARTFDIIFQSKPRIPTLTQPYSTGTVATTAGSTTVTLSGSTWPAGLAAGCLFRLGNTAPPTGLVGDNPYVEEHLVSYVTDSTHLELVDAMGTTASGVKYCVDDPIDIEGMSMQSYFDRLCEANLMILHQSGADKIAQARQIAYDAMVEAKGMDSRLDPAAVANSCIVTGVNEAMMGMVTNGPYSN